jgi:3-oxoacyl-ACP reductase-like protein
VFQFSLQSSDLKEIAVDDGYTIKAFVEYSGEKITKKALSQMMAVFERNVDHVLVFMKVNFERKEDKDTLLLEVLGDTVKKPFIIPSTIPIKKWLLQVSNDADGNPFSTAVALREDGSTDFYYNFRRVESNNETLISDIDFDFTYIYLRELNDSEEGETLHRIMHSWKGRIGMSVVESKLLEQAKLNRTWSRITSKRVSTYMKLYASLCTYEAYVLVAHRNFVSVFDISHETWQHHEYNDLVRYMG